MLQISTLQFSSATCFGHLLWTEIRALSAQGTWRSYPSRTLDSLGRAALPPVTRGGNNRRSSFTERISKDVWDLAGTDRKGSPGSSRGTRRGPEVGECARLGPASCGELCSCRRNAQSFAAG